MIRLEFWRAGKTKAQVEQTVAIPAHAQVAPAETVAASGTAVPSGDVDVRLLGRALARKRGFIIVPTLLALALSITAVNFITPRYKSEARILIDGRDIRTVTLRSLRAQVAIVTQDTVLFDATPEPLVPTESPPAWLPRPVPSDTQLLAPVSTYEAATGTSSRQSELSSSASLASRRVAARR